MNTPATENTPVVITQYEALQADIAIAKQEAAKAVFDYASKEGNKAARSYVYGIRKLNAKIEKARKEAKAFALEYGRTVDGKAREMKDEVEQLSLPHQVELDKIEQVEVERKQKHESRINRIIELRKLEDPTADQAKMALDLALNMNTDGLEEYTDQGKAELAQTTMHLERQLAKATAAEEQAAELERLRKEAEQRAEQDRIEAAKREAVEAERKRALEEQQAKEAAAKAEAERLEQERINRELAEKREAERKEQEAAKREADLRAEKERLIKEAEEMKAQAAKQEAERIEAEKAKQAAAEASAKAEAERKGELAKRYSENKKAAIDAIADVVASYGDNWHELAGDVFAAIQRGEIPFVTTDLKETP